LNSWSFVLDGQTVLTSKFPLSYSTDPAFVVAEATAASDTSKALGPVEFSQLSYFHGANWRQVDSLIALSYCGTSVPCIGNSYGAASIGPGILLVGSNVPRPTDGSLLWTSRYVPLDIQVHPGAQFFVSSVLGATEYEGSAHLDAPKGMFVYVSLSTPVTTTPGLLGLLGSQDRFQRWTGAVNSRNLTIQILMTSNVSIAATWSTDTTVTTILLIIATALVLVTVIGSILKRKQINHVVQ
jgi:hypothetical protein